MFTQVGRVAVVNKQYVKVFPADGVNSSEVVSKIILCRDLTLFRKGPLLMPFFGFVFQDYLWFNIGSVALFEHKLEMVQEEMGLDSTQKVPVLYTSESDG